MRLCPLPSLPSLLPGLFAAAAAAIAAPALAVNDVLSDSDLVARANTVFSVKEPPTDRIIGLHKSQLVIVDVRCSDVCPNNTVRIIHYAGAADAVCAQTGADLVTVNVPRSLTLGPEKFCVPHLLVKRRLYTDRPYQY